MKAFVVHVVLVTLEELVGDTFHTKMQIIKKNDIYHDMYYIVLKSLSTQLQKNTDHEHQKFLKLYKLQLLY